jgi:Virulence factor BrkB
VIWLVASVLFSWYVANFGSYNKTYGSLGAIIGFMTWIWISIIVVLVGAKLDAETQHRTARKATAGKPQPRGAPIAPADEAIPAPPAPALLRRASARPALRISVGGVGCHRVVHRLSRIARNGLPERSNGVGTKCSPVLKHPLHPRNRW